MKSSGEYIAPFTANKEYPAYYHERDVEQMIEAAVTDYLTEAAKKVDYPYRDKFGCHCDVPSIVLSLIPEITS